MQSAYRQNPSLLYCKSYSQSSTNWQKPRNWAWKLWFFLFISVLSSNITYTPQGTCTSTTRQRLLCGSTSTKDVSFHVESRRMITYKPWSHSTWIAALLFCMQACMTMKFMVPTTVLHTKWPLLLPRLQPISKYKMSFIRLMIYHPVHMSTYCNVFDVQCSC